MRTMSWLLLGTLSAALIAGAAQAEGKKDKPNMPSGEMARPGPMHQHMGTLAGEWTTVTKFRGTPDAKPVETEGRATLSMILDGRFLREESSGKFMGKDVKSVKLYGYNMDSKHFESVWMYTESTAMLTMTGIPEEESGKTNWTGHVEVNGGKMDFRLVTQLQDDDHFTVSMYGKGPDGKDGPSFETTYTRKK